MFQTIVYICATAAVVYLVLALFVWPALDLTKAGAKSLRHRRQRREREDRLAQEMKKYHQE